LSDPEPKQNLVALRRRRDEVVQLLSDRFSDDVLDLDELERRLGSEEVYVTGFRQAFGDETVSAAAAARALASYVRTLRSGDAPIDRHLAGDDTALSDQAQRGLGLFTGRANCGACHLVPLFTDHQFRNTGVSWGSGDTGRYAVAGHDDDRGAFKVPSLRNVAATAPYMHDGSLATLDDVIDFYDRGGGANPYLDDEIQPLGLTASERAAIRAFLDALTGDIREGVATRSTAGVVRRGP
jgi:cytochrome c peroxidase